MQIEVNTSTRLKSSPLWGGWLGLLFIFFFSCVNKEKYPGFSETDTGLFYKLKVIGEGKQKSVQGQYLSLRIKYLTEKDSLFADSLTIISFHEPAYKGSFEEGLSSMNEGDVIVYIQNADSLFKEFLKKPLPGYINRGSIVKLEVRLNKIINKSNIAEERKRMIEDQDIEERKRLLEYVNENKIHAGPMDNGMYCIPMVQGDGPQAEIGKHVVITYKGYFLDGREFDSTSYPVDFTIGDKYQVIKGLEIGITFMKQGEKTKFIIPSQLAYGEKGSSTGVVPPYTTVVYEVELLTVK